jgi:hypothetical protein
MHLRNILSLVTLAAFVATLTVGCSEGTDVKLAPAPPSKPAPTEPLPKDAKKGGGPSSSGNSGMNPGGNS